jgi:menaquinone-dependent protoporphyrinogen IX oxidase
MKLSKGRGAVSDGADTNSQTAPNRQLTASAEIIVLYFSRSGNTEVQAQYAQTVLGADIYELVVAQPYPANYSRTVERATAERESQVWPKLLATDLPELQQYTTILLGHPIWAMTIANPVRQFLLKYADQLAGKRVASFSTNAGYGAGDTQQILRQILPVSTQILTNYTVHDIDLERQRPQFKKWLDTIASD